MPLNLSVNMLISYQSETLYDLKIHSDFDIRKFAPYVHSSNLLSIVRLLGHLLSFRAQCQS